MNKIKKEYAKKAVEQNPEIQEQKTAVVEQEQPKVEQPVEEKPKRKYRKKSEKEQEEREKAAKEKREKAKAENRQRRREDYLKALEAHWEEEREKLKEDREKAYRKFTCPELIKIFGGWFTLTYAFSEKYMTRGKGRKMIEAERDYYIASQDVNHLDVNSRPALNKVIQNAYGKDVYGFAIIAPASAFGEKLED